MSDSTTNQEFVERLKSRIEAEKQDLIFLQRVERAVYAVAEDDSRETENIDLSSIDQKMAQA
ncbi:MAG: hypothetical protein WCV72_03825 [Patescibacteria group bacterium]|jgi:hypothetical protein